MSKLRLWLKQKFCTHYHTTHNGLPVYSLFTKRRVFGRGLGEGVRDARHDIDGVTCLNCGVKYFDMSVDGTPFHREDFV